MREAGESKRVTPWKLMLEGGETQLDEKYCRKELNCVLLCQNFSFLLSEVLIFFCRKKLKFPLPEGNAARNRNEAVEQG